MWPSFEDRLPDLRYSWNCQSSCRCECRVEQPSPNLLDLILGHEIDLVIDTPPQGVEHSRDGFLIRRTAIETGVNVLTAMDTATALVTSLENTDIRKLELIDIATVKNI